VSKNQKSVHIEFTHSMGGFYCTGGDGSIPADRAGGRRSPFRAGLKRSVILADDCMASLSFPYYVAVALTSWRCLKTKLAVGIPVEVMGVLRPRSDFFFLIYGERGKRSSV